MTNPFDTETTKQTNSDDPLADLLASIKNDKGEPKYKDVQAALAALKESQEFIPTLLTEKSQVQKELEQAREELTKRQTLEELTEALKSKPQQKEPVETPQGKPDGVGVADIDKLLEQKLAQRDQVATQSSNLKSVVDQVTAKYGDKASEHIRKIAESVGSTVDELKNIASTNPKLALRLLDVNGSTPAPNSVSSTRNGTREISEDNPMPTFERGAARGGLTDRQLRDRWREVAKYTNKRIGVEN